MLVAPVLERAGRAQPRIGTPDRGSSPSRTAPVMPAASAAVRRNSRRASALRAGGTGTAGVAAVMAAPRCAVGCAVGTSALAHADPRRRTRRGIAGAHSAPYGDRSRDGIAGAHSAPYGDRSRDGIAGAHAAPNRGVGDPAPTGSSLRLPESPARP